MFGRTVVLIVLTSIPCLAGIPREPSISPFDVRPSSTDVIIPVDVHTLRVIKCHRIISAFYDHPGRANFGPHIEYFISYHEQLEDRYVAAGDVRARGFGATWWWSLVYGGANFSMRCYAKAPGSCAGPLDVKHSPLVLDPEANIRHHVWEMFDYYVNHGVRDLDLCKWVMYPARPHDWGNGRFRRTNERHQREIVRAYELGLLPRDVR